MSKLSDKIGKFTTIPNSVIKIGGQLGTDALVLFMVLRYHSDDNDVSFPSYDTIQQESGLIRRKIAQAIRQLEHFQLLERKRRFGNSTLYILKLPSISNTGGLMEDAPLVTQVDAISNTGGLSLVTQVDTNKTQLTRPIKKKSPNGEPPVKTQEIKDLEYLEKLFAETRGVPMPDWEFDPRAAQKTWRTPLKSILKQCHSLEEAEEVITVTIEHMRKDRLTFTKPVQILETALSMRADRRNGKQHGEREYVEIY